MKKMAKLIKIILNIFNKYYPMSAVILLALIVFLTLWQISNLYFWTDDWDLFLRVVHPNLELWGMRPGWFGSGPYRYLHTPFMPFFPIFGLNATPYFIGSIFVYFIAAVSAFLLFLEITRKRSLAIGAAVIYASLGYVGSYTILHLSNSYQNLGTVIFTTLTLWILARYYRTNNILYYLLSLFLFYASLEIENLRAHGLIFLVIGLTILYCKWKKSIWNLLINIVKIIPFILIYRNLYSATLGSGNTTTVGSFLYTMERDKLFAYFINPFASFSNVIVPDNVTKFIYSFFGSSRANVFPELLLVASFLIIVIYSVFKNRSKAQNFLTMLFIVVEILYFLFNRWALKQSILATLDASASFTSMLGMTMLLFALLISIRVWNSVNVMSKAILFGIILIFGHYIGYFVGIPGYSYLATVDRYLTPSVVGTAILLGTLFYLTRIRKFSLFPILSVIYCFYFIVLMNFTINTVVNDISKPTKKLYENIKKITPSLPSKAVLYLDFENNPNLRYQVYSSFPNTAFALFYKWENRVPNIRTFEEYLQNIKNNKMKIDDLVSYYISQEKVIETSKTIHNLLKNPSIPFPIEISKWTTNTDSNRGGSYLSTSPFILQRERDSVGVGPKLEANINYPSLAPMMLSITLTASPVDFEGKRFPYYDVSDQMPDRLIKEDLDAIDIGSIRNNGLPCEDVAYLMKLDKERKEFAKYAKIDTTSQTLYSEKNFLTDGDIDTNWNGFILKWNNTKREEVIIDLGQEKELDKLIWVNYLKRTTPVDYGIFTSSNKNIWKKVKEVKDGPGREDREFVVDQFAKQNARYVKMVITNTFSNLSPAISEIWISSIGTQGVLVQYNQQIIEKPLLCPLNNIEEYIKIKDVLRSAVNLRVWWLTSSRENYDRSFSKDLEIIADGLPHVYDIYIPAQGVNLERVMLSDFQLPVSIVVGNSSIRSLTFKEIDELGYIRIPTGKSN